MIKNLEKISPVKREKVKRGLEYIEQINDGIVEKVILFGSSVTGSCTEKSDIDICLVSDGTCKNPVFFQIRGGLESVMDDLCDILVYQRIGGPLKKEIDQKGVVVYEFRNDKR